MRVSGGGGGVARARAGPQFLQSVCQFSETWRFNNHECLSLRALARSDIVKQVFQESGAAAAQTVSDSISNSSSGSTYAQPQERFNDTSFNPQAFRFDNSCLGYLLRLCVSAPWSRQEHISVFQARALVSTLCLFFKESEYTLQEVRCFVRFYRLHT